MCPGISLANQGLPLHCPETSHTAESLPTLPERLLRLSERRLPA